MSTSALAAAATPSPTAQPTQAAQQSSGPQNSPLLFFVALGFGVVFTNLWIIVGVKYCFRYNARNRARQHGEDGEPIDLAAMPQHRRRRREKKLMTMDEVNERFPITKYKTWVASRAAQGLSTEGGVSQSRAASIKEAEGIIEPIGESSTIETGKQTETSTAHADSEARASTSSATASGQGSSSAALENGHYAPADESKTIASRSDAPEDEEEGIPAAVPGASEMLEVPGDSCAICIDTLEDDDDVRGLTCGHAFHASCLDPWLTSRRACCPLCKADYYVPKPRPELLSDPSQSGTSPSDFAGRDANGNPVAPTAEWAEPRRPSLAAGNSAGGLSRYIPRLTGRVEPLPARRAQNNGSASGPAVGAQEAGATSEQAPQSRTARLTSMFGRNRGNNATSPQPAADQPEGNIDSSRWRAAFPRFGRGGASTTAQQATPGQLEAGNNTTTTTTV